MNAYATLTVALGAAVCLSAQPPDFTPPTPLFAAVLRNDTAAIKQALARGADPNEAQFLGFKPLFFPIIYQNLDALRAMVKHGAPHSRSDHPSAPGWSGSQATAAAPTRSAPVSAARPMKAPMASLRIDPSGPGSRPAITAEPTRWWR